MEIYLKIGREYLLLVLEKKGNIKKFKFPEEITLTKNLQRICKN